MPKIPTREEMEATRQLRIDMLLGRVPLPDGIDGTNDEAPGITLEELLHG